MNEWLPSYEFILLVKFRATKYYYKSFWSEKVVTSRIPESANDVGGEWRGSASSCQKHSTLKLQTITKGSLNLVDYVCGCFWQFRWPNWLVGFFENWQETQATLKTSSNKISVSKFLSAFSTFSFKLQTFQCINLIWNCGNFCANSENVWNLCKHFTSSHLMAFNFRPNWKQKLWFRWKSRSLLGAAPLFMSEIFMNSSLPNSVF